MRRMQYIRIEYQENKYDFIFTEYLGIYPEKCDV